MPRTMSQSRLHRIQPKCHGFQVTTAGHHNTTSCGELLFQSFINNSSCAVWEQCKGRLWHCQNGTISHLIYYPIFQSLRIWEQMGDRWGCVSLKPNDCHHLSCLAWWMPSCKGLLNPALISTTGFLHYSPSNALPDQNYQISTHWHA